MFTGKSILKMSDYMIMYDEKENCQNIISKRSHQCWKKRGVDGSYRLFHKENEAFVSCGTFNSPFDCVLEIASYDDKVLKALRRKKAERKKWANNFLYRLIQQFFDKPATV